MIIQLYDLAGTDENLRFSPFCWRWRIKAWLTKPSPGVIATKPKSSRAVARSARTAAPDLERTSIHRRRCVSSMKMLTDDDSVYAWRKRLLDYFDGMAGKAPAREI